MDFEVLALEHVEIQKYHIDLKQKKKEFGKVQETLHTIIQRVNQKVVEEGLEVPIEEKVKKVFDTISGLQVKVCDLQLKIKPNTPLEERERRKKVDEALDTLQQLSIVKPDFQALNKIRFKLYAQLLVAPSMQQINQEVQEVDERSTWVRESIVTLSTNACRSIMQESTTIVTKAGQLHTRKQELLRTITKLQDEALQLNEQDVSIETKVETLVKES